MAARKLRALSSEFDALYADSGICSTYLNAVSQSLDQNSRIEIPRIELWLATIAICFQIRYMTVHLT